MISFFRRKKMVGLPWSMDTYIFISTTIILACLNNWNNPCNECNWKSWCPTFIIKQPDLVFCISNLILSARIDKPKFLVIIWHWKKRLPKKRWITMSIWRFPAISIYSVHPQGFFLLVNKNLLTPYIRLLNSKNEMSALKLPIFKEISSTK